MYWTMTLCCNIVWLPLNGPRHVTHRKRHLSAFLVDNIRKSNEHTQRTITDSAYIYASAFSTSCADNLTKAYLFKPDEMPDECFLFGSMDSGILLRSFMEEFSVSTLFDFQWQSIDPRVLFFHYFRDVQASCRIDAGTIYNGTMHRECAQDLFTVENK